MLHASGENKNVALYEAVFTFDRAKHNLAVGNMDRDRLVGAVRGQVAARRERHQNETQWPFLHQRARRPAACRQQLTIDYELILRQMMNKDLALDHTIHR